MMVRVEDAPFPCAADLPFEVVERKGRGHPDTLCDAIAETASRYYCRYFSETYGRLAHHWFDKVMLIGGQSRLGFGDGELCKPYRLIFAGKGVRRVGAEEVPVRDLLHRAAKDVLTATLRNFRFDHDLVIVDQITDYRGPINLPSRYTPSGADGLVDLTAAQVSNDCNVCSGFAPLSPIESAVLALEQHLTSQSYLAAHPHTGTDVKVVGFRQRDAAQIIINIPLIAAEVTSYEDYRQKVAAIRQESEEFVLGTHGLAASISVNPQDVSGKPYLTVTGSVADTGDVGVVGRGNRLNGLITPMRPMSIEAACGKNPVDHTGKLYGLLSQRIADRTYEQFNVANQVHIVTFKERPVTDPELVVVYAHDAPVAAKPQIATLAHEHVAKAQELTGESVASAVELW